MLLLLVVLVLSVTLRLIQKQSTLKGSKKFSTIVLQHSSTVLPQSWDDALSNCLAIIECLSLRRLPYVYLFVRISIDCGQAFGT